MNLYKMTAHEISNLLKNKKVSAVEVTESVYSRIDDVENKIGAYITLCREEALKRATELQKQISIGDNLPPLIGIPMGLKDNMCTKGIKTTCASKILHNFIPPYNATVVEKLYDQGTILLGKLNMDEFAMGSSTENSSVKKTRNPWDIQRIPGGSSGGSAASVAAGEAFFALGSDTGGSIRQPAALCGVVGLKPTYGAVSRYGLVAYASSLDQIGPLTKDVTDCALVMNAIYGYDKKDSTSIDLEHPDYTSFLNNDVRGLKLGIPKEYISEGINPEVKKSVLDAIKLFESLGATCEEFSLPITEYAIPAYYIIASAEASSNLARYDGIKYGYRPSKFSDLLDLYIKTRSEGFGSEVKRRIMLGTYALSSGYYDAYYKKAQQVRTLIKNGFDEALKKYDLIIGPTSPETAFRFGEKTDDPISMYLCDIYTVSVNITGLPGLSIPCGLDSNNLPIGLQLIGKAFDEGTLIKAGYTYEVNANFNQNLIQNVR